MQPLGEEPKLAPAPPKVHAQRSEKVSVRGVKGLFRRLAG
jgi:hypothetical protein